MEEGYLLDHTYGAYRAGTWVEGPPEKSWLHGLRIGDRTQIPVRTYRCTRCGFLESYAIGQ